MKIFTGFYDATGKEINVGDILIRKESEYLGSYYKDRRVEIIEDNGEFLWKTLDGPKTEYLYLEPPRKFVAKRTVKTASGDFKVGKYVSSGKKKKYLHKE